MTGELVLALDIGTGSLRSALFTTSGRRLRETTAQRHYRVRTAAPRMAELAPATLLRAARACIGETLERQGADPALRHRTVAAIGTSCFWHSLLGVDDAGEPLTPVLTWADARCVDDAAALRSELDVGSVHARTGCMLHTSFWPAKLRWLRHTQPRVFQSVRHWLSPAEWLYWRLAGVRACANGMATATGLYDPTRLDWDDEMLSVCGVRREQLGPIDDGEQAMQAAQAGRRGRLGALADARWYAAIGDGAAGNLGSGAVRPGTAAINLGSSAAIRVMRRGARARAPIGLFAYRVDREHYLVGGPISNAGNLLDWCRRELALPDDEVALARALRGRRRPEHGLTVLPFWTAERAPSWRDDMTGCVLGLTQATSALDLAQALTEAAYYRLADIADQVLRGVRDPEIVVSGGLSRSLSGIGRLADVLGRDVVACREPEASLRGAAVDALRRSGLGAPRPPGGRPVAADRDATRAHRARRRAQSALEAELYGGRTR